MHAVVQDRYRYLGSSSAESSEWHFQSLASRLRHRLFRLVVDSDTGPKGSFKVLLKGYYKGSFQGLYKGVEFPQIRGTLFWGPYNEDPILFRVFSETPKYLSKRGRTRLVTPLLPKVKISSECKPLFTPNPKPLLQTLPTAWSFGLLKGSWCA